MAHRGSRGIALPFHDHGTIRSEGSAPFPGRSLPPVKSRYPLYRRLGALHGRSGQVRKISPLPGFDPQTVQPVASPYTDCVIPAHVGTVLSSISRSSVSARVLENKKEKKYIYMYAYLTQFNIFTWWWCEWSHLGLS